MEIDWEQKVPFIIGITGHRDLASLPTTPKAQIDEASIKQELQHALTHWREQLSKNTPIWLLSGMAEGADLLAIEAAQSLWQANNWPIDSLKIIPCLAMEDWALTQDYQPEQHHRFQALLAQYRSNQLVLSNGLSVADYQTAMSDTQYGELRSGLYLNLGAFIGKYSNVVISLWDQDKQDGIGGTANVVHLKCGIPPQWPKGTENPVLSAVSDFDGQVGGLVHNITVRRIKVTPANKPLYTLLAPIATNASTCFDIKKAGHQLYVTHIAVAQEYHDGYKQTQLFLSEEFQHLIESINRFNQNSKIPEDDMPEYPEMAYIKKGLGLGYPLFKQADSAANYYKKAYKNVIFIFTLIAMIGFGAYEIWANHLGSWAGLALDGVILVAVLLCWKIVIRAKKNQLKWHFQMARGVAESMRIKGFLNLAGLAPSHSLILPRRFRKHLSLFNHVAEIAELNWWQGKVKIDLSAVNEYWLKNQISFIKTRLSTENQDKPIVIKIINLVFKRQWDKRPKLADDVLSKVSGWLFFMSVILGTIMFVMQSIMLTSPDLLPITAAPLLNNMMLTIQFSLMFAAVMALWVELANYGPTTAGYENMLQLYQRALFLLENTEKLSQQQIDNLLSSLAREAIQEHAEWNYYEAQTDIKHRTMSS